MGARYRYLVLRFSRVLLLLVFAMTLVFFVIHFGPAAPADQSAASLGLATDGEALEQKREFGLTQPLWRQYGTYLLDMFTLDFGETWSERQVDIAENQTTSDVNVIVSDRSKRTGWLWLWTGVVTAGLVAIASFAMRNRSRARLAAGAGLAGAAPAFLLALIFETTFASLGQLLFGLDWRTFLVDTPIITRPIPVDELGTIDGFLTASKLAFPPALALSIPLASTLTFVLLSSYRRHEQAPYVRAARARGLGREAISLKYICPNTLLSCRTLLRSSVAVLIGGTVLVETVFRLEGLGTLLYSSMVRHDYTTLQATFFVFLLAVVAAILVEEVLTVLLGGAPADDSRATISRNAARDGTGLATRTGPSKLRPVGVQRGLRSNLRSNPLSAALWAAIGAFLLVLEFGTLVQSLLTVVPGLSPGGDLPTLLAQRTIPNSGFRTGSGGWNGTFLSLPPAIAWGIRVLVVYLYAAAWVGWLWLGHRIYRTEYRPASWTASDAALARFREHRVGVIGAVVVLVLLVAAVFAPVIATTPIDQTHAHTSLHGTESDIDYGAEVTYYDDEAGAVQTTSVREANFDSASNPQKGIGPGEYDEYGRFHPLGTTSEGTDMLSELLHGLRIYLLVAGGGAILTGVLAGLLSGVTAATRRRSGVDLLTDAIAFLPVLPFVLLASAMFYPRLDSIATQLLVWLVLFGLLGGVWLWRAVDPTVTPADARSASDLYRSMGMSEERSQLRVMRRRIRSLFAPIVVYSTMSAAGFVVTIAALSYLGRFSPVSPHSAYEWGTFVWLGKGARLSESGHLFAVPAAALVTLVTGLYCVAIGLRSSLAVESNEEADPDGLLTGLGDG